MDAFFVNGKDSSLADIILKNTTKYHTCYVASFGFGIKQINLLIDRFENVLLVADNSHAKLNKTAYDKVIEMNNEIPNFVFKETKTHAKLAIIDDDTIIFTSANLSKNHRMESYLIGKITEINGIEHIKEIFGNPSSIFEVKESNNDIDNEELNLDHCELKSIDFYS